MTPPFFVFLIETKKAARFLKKKRLYLIKESRGLSGARGLYLIS
jgi:hypothetical protein